MDIDKHSDRIADNLKDNLWAYMMIALFVLMFMKIPVPAVDGPVKIVTFDYTISWLLGIIAVIQLAIFTEIAVD